MSQRPALVPPSLDEALAIAKELNRLLLATAFIAEPMTAFGLFKPWTA